MLLLHQDAGASPPWDWAPGGRSPGLVLRVPRLPAGPPRLSGDLSPPPRPSLCCCWAQQKVSGCGLWSAAGLRHTPAQSGSSLPRQLPGWNSGPLISTMARGPVCTSQWLGLPLLPPRPVSALGPLSNSTATPRMSRAPRDSRAKAKDPETQPPPTAEGAATSTRPRHTRAHSDTCMHRHTETHARTNTCLVCLDGGSSSCCCFPAQRH